MQEVRSIGRLRGLKIMLQNQLKNFGALMI